MSAKPMQWGMFVDWNEHATLAADTMTATLSLPWKFIEVSSGTSERGYQTSTWPIELLIYLSIF